MRRAGLYPPVWCLDARSCWRSVLTKAFRDVPAIGVTRSAAPHMSVARRFAKNTNLWFCAKRFEIFRRAAKPMLDGSGRVVVQIDFVCQGDNLAVGIVTARRAYVVRAFQLATVRAFIRVGAAEGVMCAARVAARFGYFVLLDGHVAIPIPMGQLGPVNMRFSGS